MRAYILICICVRFCVISRSFTIKQVVMGINVPLILRHVVVVVAVAFDIVDDEDDDDVRIVLNN